MSTKVYAGIVMPAVRLFLIGCLFLAPGFARAAERWVYVADNLLVDDPVQRLEALIQRSAKAGYTHLLLADSKFCRLADMPERYFQNAERIKRSAATNKIELIPAVFPVGYSNDLLFQDPNLVEGPPVRAALFIVRDGEARHAPDPPPVLRGGDMSDLKAWSLRDTNMIADAGAVRVTNPGGANARIAQKLALSPFRQYRVTVRIKSENFRGTPEIKAIANGHVLNYNGLGVQRTQDWRTHQVVFNSLDHREVTLYFGAWGATSGSLWWDDATIEEIGLVNLIRREGAPLQVRLESGERLQEGTDFEPVKDPLMGTRPYAGNYDIYHEPPNLRMKKPLPEGTRLRVSYYHAATIYDGQAMIDIAEPRTEQLLRDQARRVHNLFHARGYMMSHDEIRVLGWSEAFRRRGLTPGELIAENARQCIKTLRELNPNGEIYVWSDMFDPHHNAVAGPYYLVNGPLTGSWEGLDRNVVVMQWHGENAKQRAESLKFFADRGQRQILAAYYDAGPQQVRAWLESARGVPGIIGVMYTTWQHKYDDLEAVAGVAFSQ